MVSALLRSKEFFANSLVTLNPLRCADFSAQPSSEPSTHPKANARLGQKTPVHHRHLVGGAMQFGART